MKLKAVIPLAIVLSVFVCGTVTTRATPIVGADIFVQNAGQVVATFVGSDAGFDNLILLSSPPNSLGVIFEGHVTSPGTAVNLGVFTAGTELIFELNNQVGGTFFTGPASRNPDNIAHASVDNEFAPGQTLVGFEDSFGGGDRDYNDVLFTVSNAGSNAVPDSGATLMLLATGLSGLELLRRSVRA